MPSADPLLLDTHALLWWQARSSRLSRRARRAIESTHQVLVSPISFWEVGMLVAKGRVALDRATGVWVSDLLAGGTVGSVELTPMIAVAAAELPDFHGDPADRLVYATARATRAQLVTKDPVLRSYAASQGGVRTLW